MNREFVMVGMFDKRWKGLGLTDDDLKDLQDVLINNPKIGNVIQGIGKLRKMRFAVPGHGKSKGARVLYVDFELYHILYLITVYQKNQQITISDSDKKDFKKFIQSIEDSLKIK